ncbi:DUF2628 domain-containing protein [Salipaludibacillus agaradhaerens]|jgi:hypothetical protein|uniref:DUF2628 domain-containing protein n=1 Tax=Salipaludibacillus agaradhaerens TaxID=76935 RepID=UPI002150933A|nr:DUF2628 domain-containing protein [Salipaludibacillus agaradhaerens]MCR6105310.1 DUF2628 domain-containing protein [Salipaludibacillus agaradhaerens]MCR6117351.1 DUF2628 domain-containing protein [Salipaludibacillus agaradhaerens]UJW56550.1 DUF2628 domain-containing protein [Bacillus sp. A116_S68]
MTHQKPFSEHDFLARSDDIQPLIATNVDYYFNKWHASPAPFSFSGWNWAAFLLAPFWLAYRHMYGSLLITSLIYFMCQLLVTYLPLTTYLGLSQELSDTLTVVWQISYPIMIHLFFGWKGNALYARRIAMLTQWKKGLRDKPLAPLFSKSGTSMVTAIIIPFLLLLGGILSLFAVEDALTPSLPPGVYIFSDSEPSPSDMKNTTLNPSFEKYSARINFVYIGEEPVEGRLFTIRLYYKADEGMEWVLEREREYDIFTSNRVVLDVVDAEDPAVKTGRYRLVIYVEDEVEAEEQFTIVPPSH